MSDESAQLGAEGSGGEHGDPQRRTAENSRGAGERLCRQFIEELPVTGASISVMSSLGQSTIGTTDQIAARIEQLQFELGEGPHHDALRTRDPVLIPDLSVGDPSHWPIFAPAARELGAGALFAFPLNMGAVTVGVADLYRTEPGRLDVQMVSRALALAASTAAPALRLAAGTADDDSPRSGAVVPELRREVHQATGMVLAQLNTTATEAFSRLQAYSFSHGRSLEDVAHEVVTRRLDFRDLDD